LHGIIDVVTVAKIEIYIVIIIVAVFLVLLAVSSVLFSAGVGIVRYSLRVRSGLCRRFCHSFLLLGCRRCSGRVIVIVAIGRLGVSLPSSW
jgi:hypothetical protein